MLVRSDVARLPLAADGIDMIFTDPPYAQAALPCYGWLAAEAARILKPGGFVLAMCGGANNGPIHKMFLDAGLSCFFDIAYVLPYGSGGYLHHYQVLVRSKFILSYSKGPGSLRVPAMQNMYTGRKDKRFHHWGQDVDSARYFIDHFTEPGDLVADPMVGGGTTGVACQLLGRRFVGMDLDMAALKITQARLTDSDAVRPLPLWSHE
jgi:DNA modification methylase